MAVTRGIYILLLKCGISMCSIIFLFFPLYKHVLLLTMHANLFFVSQKISAVDFLQGSKGKKHNISRQDTSHK